MDAVHGRNGYSFGGARLRVEIAGGANRRGPVSGGPRRFSGQRSEHRIEITGLPPSGSWQDLKDFCRESGDVLYSDVGASGVGTVEFLREEDMRDAVANLDGKKFTSHTGETTYVTVKRAGGGRSSGG